MPNSQPAVLDQVFAREAVLSKYIAKAQRNLVQAQSHGLYEGNRLIAVMPEKKSTNDSSTEVSK